MTIKQQGGIFGRNPSFNNVDASRITASNINGPAFSAYGDAAQTVTTDTFTKVTFNAEDFDTAGNFDSTTNYRFTPSIAGTYLLACKLSYASTSSLSRIIVEFRKNGSGAIMGREYDETLTFGTFGIINNSTIVEANGSTDFFEIYVYLSGAGTLSVSSNDKNTSYFRGAMLRGS